MAVLRPHLALTVSSVTGSVPFYEALFGVVPEKVEVGYAKFSVAEPALNFTLNEGARDGLGAFNHAGIQVASTDEVLRAKERLVSAGLAAFDEMDTTCCYARQDKIWVRDPDGTPWEVFASHEDTDEAGDGGLAVAEARACGCGQAGCGCAAEGAVARLLPMSAANGSSTSTSRRPSIGTGSAASGTRGISISLPTRRSGDRWRAATRA